MKLLYINMVENDFIEDKEIYFSNEYKFFITDGTIKYEKNKDFKVASDNLLIKAFIGDNGSGKTTLLNRICTLNFNGIAIFKDKNNDKFYLSQKQVMIFPDENFIYLDKNSAETLFFINYNNIFNPYQIIQKVNNEDRILWKEEKYLYIMDISTDYEYFISAEGEKTKYTSNEVKNILSLFMSDTNKKSEEKILYKEIKIPEFLFIDNAKLFKLRYKELNREDIFLYQFLADLTYILLSNSFIKSGVIKDFFISEYDKGIDVVNILKRVYDYDLKNFEDIKSEIFKTLSSTYTVEYERISYELLSNILEIIKSFKNLIRLTDFTSRLSEKIQIFRIEDYGNFIVEFLENTKQYSIKEHFFTYFYDNPYSSGELAIITMFSRLFVKAKELRSIDDLCLFLDEPEIFAHPEWQRKFIMSLRKGLEILFPNTNIKVFITSHSPYLISDIPKEDVFFMERKDEMTCFKEPSGLENTFASNIHTLAKNGFFMTSTIGEYAKSKIEEVVKIINGNRYQENKEFCDYIISIIGEPLIKNKLLSMVSSQESLQDKINRKKQELEELEKLQKDHIINSIESKRF